MRFLPQWKYVNFLFFSCEIRKTIWRPAIFYVWLRFQAKTGQNYLFLVLIKNAKNVKRNTERKCFGFFTKSPAKTFSVLDIYLFTRIFCRNSFQLNNLKNRAVLPRIDRICTKADITSPALMTKADYFPFWEGRKFLGN